MSELSPTAALRAIQRVCDDLDISPAQRLAIIRVILMAGNDTALAWAAYRSIGKQTGLAPATIHAALRYAQGRYLERHAVGQNGAIQYRVALQSVKRRASMDEAPPASQDEAPALQSTLLGASPSEAKLTPYTNPSTSPKRSRRPKAPPDPRVRQFIDSFVESYRQAHDRAYFVSGAKDGAVTKRLLAALDREPGIDPMSELQRATKNMLADDWGRTNASIGVLAGQINKWRAKPSQARRPGTTGNFTPAPPGQSVEHLVKRFE